MEQRISFAKYPKTPKKGLQTVSESLIKLEQRAASKLEVPFFVHLYFLCFLHFFVAQKMAELPLDDPETPPSDAPNQKNIS